MTIKLMNLITTSVKMLFNLANNHHAEKKPFELAYSNTDHSDTSWSSSHDLNVQSSLLASFPASLVDRHSHEYYNMDAFDYYLAKHILSLSTTRFLTLRAKQSSINLEISGVLGLTCSASDEDLTLLDKDKDKDFRKKREHQFFDIDSYQLEVKKFFCPLRNSFGLDFRYKDSTDTKDCSCKWGAVFYNSTKEHFSLKQFIKKVCLKKALLEWTLKKASKNLKHRHLHIRKHYQCFFANILDQVMMQKKSQQLIYFHKFLNDALPFKKLQNSKTGSSWFLIEMVLAGAVISNNPPLYLQEALLRAGQLYFDHLPLLVYNSKSKKYTVCDYKIAKGHMAYVIAARTSSKHMFLDKLVPDLLRDKNELKLKVVAIMLTIHMKDITELLTDYEGNVENKASQLSHFLMQFNIKEHEMAIHLKEKRKSDIK